MKRFLILGLGAVAILVGDTSVKARAACAQFGGVYAGLNGGWAYLDSKWVDRDAWTDNFSQRFPLGSVSNTRGSATVGGQLGYNLQQGCTVFGVEIDWNWANIGGTKQYNPIASTGPALTMASKLDRFATARARTGLVVDSLLIFATVGLAHARIDHSWSIFDPGTPREAFGANVNRWGAVVGFGTEYSFGANWSVKSEIHYFRFNETTTTGRSAAGNQTVNFDNQDSMLVSRIGLNYRWVLPTVPKN